MGLDYILFDAALADALLSRAAALGAPGLVRADPMGGWVVQLSEDLPDAVLDAIETEYNRLMLHQRDLLDAADGADANDVLGVHVTLPGGESCQVRVPPHLGRKLVNTFSFDEIHQLVSLIAAQAVQPVDGPLCHK